MANTYTKVCVQFVFSVQGRGNFIKESFRDELEKVMYGIVFNHKCKTYAIYCNPDHTHHFCKYTPDYFSVQIKGTGQLKKMITKDTGRRHKEHKVFLKNPPCPLWFSLFYRIVGAKTAKEIKKLYVNYCDLCG